MRTTKAISLKVGDTVRLKSNTQLRKLGYFKDGYAHGISKNHCADLRKTSFKITNTDPLQGSGWYLKRDMVTKVGKRAKFTICALP